MEIIGHLIQDTDIIGIGPLYAEQSKDLMMQSLYNAFRYFFEVHCKQRSIRIEGDFFKPAGYNDHNKEKETAKIKSWKEEYFRATKLVADQIGEIIPEEQK